MITSAAVSTGPSRPPGSGRPPSVTATPYKGMGVVKVPAKPPPIPPRARPTAQRGPDRYRARAAARRRAARSSAAVTQLVTLREIVARAIDFQAPQLVTIVGNQGTGKTRLINELITALRERQRSAAACSTAPPSATPTGKPVRFAAITSLLRARFELTPNPDEASKLRFTHEVRSVIGVGSGRRDAALPRRLRRARLPADAVPARGHREREAARRARAHRAAPVHRARRGARARSCSCSTICSGPTTRRSRWSTISRSALAGSPVVLLARGAARDARAQRGLGRGRGRSHAHRSAQPRARRRRADVPQPAVALRRHSRGHRRRPRSR